MTSEKTVKGSNISSEKVNMNSFGESLQSKMKDKNLSVAQLATAIKAPKKTVQEWLGPSGRVPRDLAVLKRLASFFKCSVHEILYGEEDPHSALNEVLKKTEVHTGLYEITIKKVDR